MILFIKDLVYLYNLVVEKRQENHGNETGKDQPIQRLFHLKEKLLNLNPVTFCRSLSDGLVPPGHKILHWCQRWITFPE